MAAGIGSRYGGLKQFDPVGPSGETIIDYSIFDAVREGFGKTVFIIRHDIEKHFREKISSRFEDKTEVEYAYQELNALPDGFKAPGNREKPWGTGHAIFVTRDIVKEPFAIINADDFYGLKSFRALSGFLSAMPDTRNQNWGMVGFTLRNTLSEHGTVTRGVCREEGGLLKDIVETKSIRKDGNNAVYERNGKWVKLPGDAVVSMNMWAMNPSYYDILDKGFPKFLREAGVDEKGSDLAKNNLKSEYLVPAVIGELVNSAKATVRVLKSDENWYGVTYKEDREWVSRNIAALVKKGEYPEKLWA